MLNSQALERTGSGGMFWIQGIPSEGIHESFVQICTTTCPSSLWLLSPILASSSSSPLLLALKCDIWIPILASLTPLYIMASSGTTDFFRFLKEKALMGSTHLTRPHWWSPARLWTSWAQRTCSPQHNLWMGHFKIKRKQALHSIGCSFPTQHCKKPYRGRRAFCSWGCPHEHPQF